MPEWPGCESDPRNFTEYFPFALHHHRQKKIKEKEKEKRRRAEVKQTIKTTSPLQILSAVFKLDVYLMLFHVFLLLPSLLRFPEDCTGTCLCTLKSPLFK